MKHNLFLSAMSAIVAATPWTALYAAESDTKPEEIIVTAAPLGSVLQPTQILTSEEKQGRDAKCISPFFIIRSS